MTVMVARAVKDLHVQCSLDIRTKEGRKRGGFAMSDCCRKPATTAVEDDKGNRLYRCPEHEGIIRMDRGPVWQTVNMREEDR